VKNRTAAGKRKKVPVRKKLARAAMRAVPHRVTTRDLRAACGEDADCADLASDYGLPDRLRGKAKHYARIALSAAALALPVGLFVGRRLREREA
jgi:hypothetical protein